MIYTLTLNPAVDRVLFLDELHPGRTNRLSRRLDTIGGKGTHVSINLKLLGVESTALGFTFGENGRKITALMAAEGIQTHFLHSDHEGFESRTNYVLIEKKSRRFTMITEPGPRLSDFYAARLADQIAGLLGNGDILVLTGDAGNMMDTDIYTRLAELGRLAGARVILDASGPYLSEGLSARPYLIKPNLEELNCLAGRELFTDHEILEAMRLPELREIEIIAVTMSGSGALVKWSGRHFRVHPPRVAAVNETGCGDAFLAALIAGVTNNRSIEDTLLLAAAVAAATAEQDTTAGFDSARAEILKSQARIEVITDNA